MGEDMNKTLNENFSSKKDGHSLKRWLVSVSFILFLFNIWKFLKTLLLRNSSFISIIQYDNLFRNNHIYYSQKRDVF